MNTPPCAAPTTRPCTWRCRAGGISDQPLRHCRPQQTYGQHARQQCGNRLGHGHGHQRRGQCQQLQGHQAAAFHPVAQGHQQQQRQRTSGLCGRDHTAHRRMADAKVLRQRVQQGLRVIDIGHAQAAGHGEQPDQAAGHVYRLRRCTALRQRRG
jgi:hypothetical protein